MFKKGELYSEYSSEGFWSFKKHGNVEWSDLILQINIRNMQPGCIYIFPIMRYRFQRPKLDHLPIYPERYFPCLCVVSLYFLFNGSHTLLSPLNSNAVICI